MDNQEKDTLLKAHSYRGVLTTGLHLYTRHFKKLFKASWLSALIHAVVCGAAGTLMALKIPELLVAIIAQIQHYNGVYIQPLEHYVPTLLAIIGLLLLAIIAMATAHATIVDKLQEHQLTGDITMPVSWLKPSRRLAVRAIGGVTATLALTIGLFLVLTGLLGTVLWLATSQLTQNLLTVMMAVACIAAIIMLLALPLFYALIKYVIEPQAKYWSALGSSYACGMRHWGMLFLVFFVSTLMVILCGLVVMLPANILFVANYKAQMGLLIGDPLGMPDYMTVLTFATFVLCSFLQFYTALPLILHNYYAYGSIEAKEQERKEQQKLSI